MNKRPPSITVISWIFIAVGCIGLVRGLLPLVGAAASWLGTEGKAEPPMDYVFAAVSSLVAIAGGAGVLRGYNWARWLLVVWMGFHVALSVLHSPIELLVHCLLFAPILFFLLRPQKAAYFRGTTPTRP